MSSFEKDYQQKGVVFLAINAFEPPEQGKAFIEQSGLHYEWAFADTAALEGLGVKSVPTHIILDREGKVAWTSSLGSVAGGADAIRAALDDVLGS